MSGKQKLLVEIVFRVVLLILLVLGILDLLGLRFIWLIIAGIILGVYYGWYNDIIWNSKEENHKSFKEHPIYRGHQLWVHLVCGIIGSIAFFILLNRVNLWCFKAYYLNWSNFILLIIATLGYTGLLPRSLWFYANKGGN